MGCSNSSQAAIQELRFSVEQLETEVNSLTSELEKLHLNRGQASKQDKPPTVQLIKSMLQVYEKNLKDLNQIASRFLITSQDRSSNTTVQVQEVLEYSEELIKKVNKIEEIIKNKEKLQEEEQQLEWQIQNLENSIREIESSYYSNEEARNQHHRLHEEVSELLLKRDLNSQVVEELEKNLEDLNMEIKNSGLDDKSSNNDLTSYEVLLKMTELEVNIESKKIDQELEALAEEMKVLKAKENELQALDNVLNSRAASRNGDNESIPFVIRKSKERAELLDSEQARIREEIGFAKRSSLVEKGFEDKSDLLREFAIRRKSKEDDFKSINEKIASGFQASLNRITNKF